MDTSLKSLLIFSEIFALRTFNIAKDGDRIIFKKIKRNVFCYIRIMLCITTVILAIVYRQYIQKIDKSKGVIISSVKFSHLNCRIPLVVMCYFFGIFHTGTIVDFLNSIIQTNAAIENVGVKVNYKYVRNVSYILLCGNFFKLVLQILPYLVLGK